MRPLQNFNFHFNRYRGALHMYRRTFVAAALAAASLFSVTLLLPSQANAQADPKVGKAMADLKAATAKLGAAKLEGTEAVSGKDASALYFGSTKINNNYDVVDEVVKTNGGTATLFAKTGAEY